MHRYEAIAADLRSGVLNGRWPAGRQLPLEAELAASYAVTRGTVRRALAVLEREGRIRRERGKGTFVNPVSARAVKPMRTLFYVGAYQGHLFQDVYTELARLAQQDGVALAAYDPLHEAQPERIAERLRSARPPDSICLLSVCHWCDLTRRPPLPTPPLLFMHREIDRGSELHDHPGFHIYMPPEEAMRLATRHLLAAGHRRLAYIAGGPLEPGSENDRFPHPLASHYAYAAFAETLAAADIGEHRALATPFTERDAEKLSEKYLEHLGGWATAVVCQSDYRAVLLHHAAIQLGLRIPEDISIVGVGDTPWCTAVRPRLTSVSYELDALALLAMNLSQAPTPDTAMHFTVHPRLVERESVQLL